MSKDDLIKKKCVPCQVGTPPMPEDIARGYLSQLTGWDLVEGKLKKEYKFKDFPGSMKFVNAVAAVAESEGHHPSIFISYNKVRITLFTHAAGGLTENDFILAAKIDAIQ